MAAAPSSRDVRLAVFNSDWWNSLYRYTQARTASLRCVKASAAVILVHPKASHHDMLQFKNCSLHARNLRCVGEDLEGFDSILPVNVIVGRNNSGKSSLLELVSYACQGVVEAPEASRHAGRAPEIHLSTILTEADVRGAFPGNVEGGNFQRGISHQDAGMPLVGARFRTRCTHGKRWPMSVSSQLMARRATWQIFSIEAGATETVC